MAPKSRMVTLDSGVFKCCHKLQTLGWSNDTEAKKLLQRAANQVKPIMIKRGWAVPVLAEFYPPMGNLLGLNHNGGEKIEVRLRQPSDKNAFLPYESILGTLLHELVHIEIGPHNKQFYKLLDELNDECDKLVSAGNDGSNGKDFSQGGRRLGDWSVTTVPRYRAGNAAASAALKRHHRQGIMSQGVGGQRLGGRTDTARLGDPRIMALAAAERRFADDVWCANGGAIGGSGLASGSAGSKLDGEVEVIDSDDSDEGEAVTEVEVICIDNEADPVRPIVPAASVPVRRNAAALAALRRSGQR